MAESLRDLVVSLSLNTENFTRVMIDLGDSTDITAQDAGSTLAKFANIMGMDVTPCAEKEGVDVSGLKPEAVTAFVLAYEDVTGGALTAALTPPTDMAAIVTQYLVGSTGAKSSERPFGASPPTGTY